MLPSVLQNRHLQKAKSDLKINSNRHPLNEKWTHPFCKNRKESNKQFSLARWNIEERRNIEDKTYRATPKESMIRHEKDLVRFLQKFAQAIASKSSYMYQEKDFSGT